MMKFFAHDAVKRRAQHRAEPDGDQQRPDQLRKIDRPAHG
jgi:hypothetical protein